MDGRHAEKFSRMRNAKHQREKQMQKQENRERLHRGERENSGDKQEPAVEKTRDAPIQTGAGLEKGSPENEKEQNAEEGDSDPGRT